MKLALLLLAAAPALHFDVTDARGKRPSGIIVEATDRGPDGWTKVTVTRSKKESALVWPFDALATQPDGPGPVSVVVIERGDPKALANPRIVAYIATGVVLGHESLETAARRTGFDPAALKAALDKLGSSADDYARGVGLLWAKQPEKAAEALENALRERERQLTRVPSDIFPAALLYGRALFDSGKYDDAAVAYLKALKLRPSDEGARKGRAEALIKAGKPDAARDLPQQP